MRRASTSARSVCGPKARSRSASSTSASTASRKPTPTCARRRPRGRLQLTSSKVNTRSGTVRVRAVFDNKDGSLIPGQFVKLRMGRAQNEPAVLVSERAVGTDQNKRFVMVVGEDNKAAYREITL